MLRLRLAFRPPIDLSRMLGYLAARAVPGVEVASPNEYKPNDQPSERIRRAFPAPRSWRQLGGVLAGAI